MVAGAGVVHIAQSPFDRIGTGTVGRQKAQHKTRVINQPLLNGLRLMDFVVIHHHVEPRVLLGRIALIEDIEQLSKQRVGFPCPAAVEERVGRQIKHPGGVITASWVPSGIQAAPTLGNRWISSSSAKSMAPQSLSRSNTKRMRARCSTWCGSSSLATSLARFHTQPTSWSQRCIISAETVMPRFTCRVSASVAQLQRVRHHPRARGLP